MQEMQTQCSDSKSETDCAEAVVKLWFVRTAERGGMRGTGGETEGGKGGIGIGKLSKGWDTGTGSRKNAQGEKLTIWCK
jgi:hypothetical protein